MAYLARVVVAMVVLSVCGVVRAAGDAPKAGPPAAPAAATSQPAVAAKVTPADEYKQLADQLALIVSPAEGVPLIEKFIETYKGSPLADVTANAQLTLWKDKVDKGLMRFGDGWLDKAKVEQKNKDVDALLAKVDGEDCSTDKGLGNALKELVEAAKIHPYRTDVPFKRFEKLMKATTPREAEAGGAMGAIVKIEPKNAPALNNMGVINARQKQWQTALNLLLKAADLSPDTDAIWDNFDQAEAMALEAGAQVLVVSYDGQMRGVVGKIHKAGKHAGETRWGNSWITEVDFAKYRKENDEAAAKSGGLVNQIRQAQFNKADLERQRTQYEKSNGEKTDYVNNNLKKFDLQIQQITTWLADAQKKFDPKAAGHEATHAGKLVLLNLDGTPFDTLDGKPADAGKEGPKDKPPGHGGLFN